MPFGLFQGWRVVAKSQQGEEELQENPRFDAVVLVPYCLWKALGAGSAAGPGFAQGMFDFVERKTVSQGVLQLAASGGEEVICPQNLVHEGFVDGWRVRSAREAGEPCVLSGGNKFFRHRGILRGYFGDKIGRVGSFGSFDGL